MFEGTFSSRARRPGRRLLARAASLALGAVLWASSGAPAASLPGVESAAVLGRVEATFGFAAPHVRGVLHLPGERLDAGGANEETIVLEIPANRFVDFDDRLDDLARHALIPGSSWRGGRTEIRAVRTVDGRPLDVEPGPRPDTVRFRPPPGVGVSVEFETTLPSLLDAFGASTTHLIADGEWAPIPEGAPDLEVRVVAPEGEGLLDGRGFAPGETAEGSAEAGRLPTILVARDGFARRQLRIGDRRVELLEAPGPAFRSRVSSSPGVAELLFEVVAATGPGPTEDGTLRIVRWPLRWIPSLVSADLVVLSDRLLEIFPVLVPAHQRDVAYAVRLATELARARGRESERDAAWVAEALAWTEADRLYREVFRPEAELRDLISTFRVFSVVDRFETEPRIPLRRAVFPAIETDDGFGLRGEPRTSGRSLIERLESALGGDGIARVVAAVGERGLPFRAAVAEESAEAAAALEAWQLPDPSRNLVLESAEPLESGADGRRLRIRREGRGDPIWVDVAVATTLGEERHRVALDRDRVDVEIATHAPVASVRLDPDRRLAQTDLADDRLPRGFQVVLDSADVEVSSTEFGFSTLVVGRRPYTYDWDVAAAPFVTNRSVGVTGGVQLHGGPAIDANLFERNLYAYALTHVLDRGFDDPSGRVIGGQLVGLGLRYNDYDAYWFENPTRSRHLRVFFDAYDTSLGSDFGYVQGGASLAVTHPLRHDTILAGYGLAGFTATTSREGVPPQGLFSLGGFRAIRGIGAQDELARNVAVVRAEVRRMLPFELSLDLEEMLIARRIQVKAFVDAGRVDDDPAAVFDVGRFAVGAGTGINLFYDFMGFFPTSFYLDVATRVDRHPRPLVLFGARQPF